MIASSQAAVALCKSTPLTNVDTASSLCFRNLCSVTCVQGTLVQNEKK